MHLYGVPKIVGNDVRPPPTREYQLYGKCDAVSAFEVLARDLGRLIASDTARLLDCVAADTLTTKDDSRRWLWTLFDLAWNPAEGSPLVADQMAWAGNVSNTMQTIAQ